MGKNQQLLKLFAVLLICTGFIFTTSHYGAKAFEKIMTADGRFSDGTAIGSLDVSGKTEIEAKSLLEKKYLDWLKENVIQLQYGEKTAPFDLNQFHLDTDATMNSIKDGKKNPTYIKVDKLRVEEQVQTLFPQIKSSDLDLVKLMKSLNETASLFEAGSHTFNLYSDFLLGDLLKKDEVLSEVVLNMKEVPLGLSTVIAKNQSIEIPEESTFSLLGFAKEHKIENTGALNVIATGIYQAILPSNFSIVERNISSSLPDYAQLGYEAKISQNKQADFVFANPNKVKYHLELRLAGNQLQVRLKGGKFFYKYELSLKNEQDFNPKTIIQYSPLLQQGKTKTQTKGEEGQLVRVYRVTYEGSQLLKSELISEDYYPPAYRVEIHSLAGSQQGTTEKAGTTTNQSDTTNSNQTTENTNTNSNQPTSPSEPEQHDTNNSDLWGKPNEQPK